MEKKEPKPPSRLRRFAGWLFSVLLACSVPGYLAAREFLVPRHSGNIVFTANRGASIAPPQASFHYGVMVGNAAPTRTSTRGGRDLVSYPVTEDTYLWPWSPPIASITVRYLNSDQCARQGWTLEPAEVQDGTIVVMARHNDGCAQGWIVQRRWPGHSITEFGPAFGQLWRELTSSL